MRAIPASRLPLHSHTATAPVVVVVVVASLC